MDVHFMSRTDEWATPQGFVDSMAERYGAFDLDPCCLPVSAKAPKYFTPADDGLAQNWFGNVWMNPPYGRTIGQWVRKARTEVAEGRAVRVVALLPARTDTKWWHDNVQHHASQIMFVRGRLKFGNAVNSAPFPSVVVVWENSVGTTWGSVNNSGLSVMRKAVS